MLTPIFSDNVTQTFDSFSQFKCGKFQLQIVNIQVAQTQMLRKSAKSSARTTEVSFWRSLAGYASYGNMTDSSTVRLKAAADQCAVCEVCASLVHWQAKAAVWICARNQQMQLEMTKTFSWRS